MKETSRIIHRHSRSFSLAARFLPGRIRADVLALYAWCRTVDDVVDSATDLAAARLRLSQLKADVCAISANQPTFDPASDWITPLIRSKKIDPQHALELIEGVEMDLQGFTPRNNSHLRRYCYHVAGTVGLMMSQLMGARDPAARKHAIALGIAMQLTNIARDVREDAMRGRSYLPGIPAPLSREPADIARCVQELLELAEEQYRLAAAGIDFLPKDCRVAVDMALRVYREIGREIARQDFPVTERRVIIGRHRLVWTAVLSVLRPTLLLISNLGEPFMSRWNRAQHARIAQARSSVCLGLALTALMSSVLFLLVFVNPKDTTYGNLPLVYSGLSLLAAVVLHRLSWWFEPKTTEQLTDVA